MLWIAVFFSKKDELLLTTRQMNNIKSHQNQIVEIDKELSPLEWIDIIIF